MMTYQEVETKQLEEDLMAADRFASIVSQSSARKSARVRRAVESAVASIQSLEQRRLLAATVYVNDNWQIVTDTGPAGLSSGDTVQSNPSSGDVNVGTHTYGTDAFQTVSDGVTNVSSGGTVNVLNGNYSESNITITKPLTLDGQGYAPDVVIQPAAADGHDDSAFNVSAQQGLLIQSSGVTVSNLTIDGGTNHDYRQ